MYFYYSYILYTYFFEQLVFRTTITGCCKISQHGNWSPFRIRKMHATEELIKAVNEN